MVNELTPVNINTIPKLAQLVQRVSATGKVLRLRLGAKDLTMIIPTLAQSKRHVRRIRRDATIDSLVGVAGSLAKPRSWSEIKSVVAQERAQKLVNE